MEPRENPPDPLDLPPLLKVTPDEVSRAVPPPPRQRPLPPAPPASGPRRSKLAVCALVLGIGSLFFTCLVGTLAILAGSLAIAAVRSDPNLRGLRMAVCGLLLGIVSLGGWSWALWHYLGEPGLPRPEGPPRILEAAGGPPPREIRSTPEPYRSPLLANVVVQGSAATAQWNGSGIVIDREKDLLRILTNRHVVDPPTITVGKVSLWVLLSTGETVMAETVWRAPEGVDLAVLEVRAARAEEVPVIPVRRKVVRFGDEVFAVGNPLEYRWSLTKGVVSSIRDIDLKGRKLKVYQTQTPISPGNSGGGLYAADGMLVGINTWAADKSVAEGLGFSISVHGLLEAWAGAPAAWAARLLREAGDP